MQVSRKTFYAFFRLLSYFILAALVLPGAGVEASTAGKSAAAELPPTPPSIQSQLLLASYADPDFDGIPTEIEQAGWFNANGGPYVTNPNLNDSDGDGLLDGAEQLFDTNPLDNKSPGVFVQYQDSYKTREYFGWNRHGSRYISHGAASVPALVVRRGSKIVVGGPADGNLSVEPVQPENNLGSLPAQLNAAKNSCAGGWTINIPSNGTAGKYRLTMQAGGWSDTLDLYVIFNIPGSLPETQIASFLYDDNPDDVRDEVSVWFDTVESPEDSDIHEARGIAYAFYNQQFEEWLLKDHVIDVISGKTSPETAAGALTTYLDRITRFNNNNYTPNMQKAIQEGDGDPTIGLGAQCSNIANMLTGFNRAAGIPARPFLVDWFRFLTGSGKFDHATEIYLDNLSGNDKWRAYRGYNVRSGGEDCPPPPGTCLPINGGTVGPRTRTQWGQGGGGGGGANYPIALSDIMIAGGPDWNFNHVSDLGNNNNPDDSSPGRGKGREYAWDNNTENNNNPCEIVRHNWVEVPVMEYWPTRWPALWGCNEPVDVGDPVVQSREAPLTAAETGAEPSRVATIPGIAQFTGVISDAGVDTNGNGRFDKLVVQLQVEAFQSGAYFIGALLADGLADPSVNNGIQDVTVPVTLNAGLNTVSLEFGGLAIGENEVDGPYTLVDLWISNAASPDPIALHENLLDYRAIAYTTTAYKSASFEQFGADLSGSYTHNATDQNGDGYMDRLVINTPLNIVTPGSYSVEAELTDSQGESVATATWSGSDGQVSLQFEALLSQMTPYLLSSINLYDSSGRLIDYADSRSGVYSAGPFYSLGLSAASVVTPTVTSVSTPDSDGNGKYDSLDFNVSLSIAVSGSYRLEGWLEASDGTLLSWQTSAPAALGVGTQNMTLAFPGQAISNFRIDGPYKLTALKVLKDSYTVIDEIPVAYETNAYGASAFQPGFDASAYILIDRGVSSNWSSSNTDWSLTTSAASSPLFAWTDSPNGNYSNNSSKKLTSKSFNIANGAAAQVTFQTCYNIGSGDQGRIEVNLPGGWQAAPGVAYTGASSGWSQQNLSLPPVIGSNSLAFRFVLSADGSGSNPDGWYVDDTFVKLDYDLDDDGISNVVEAVTDDGVAPPPYPDTDGDGAPDYLDTDTDGDGIPDSIEGAGDADGDGDSNFRDLDSDGDGVPDQAEGTGDSDGDGIPNFLDNPNGSNNDVDGDTISNTHENIPGLTDADGDGVGNAVDPDSDNDGIADEVEAGDPKLNTPPVDTDNDGLPDFVDTDSDNDGLPDSQEGPGDLDGDGTPDYLDTDRDGDGMPDRWEVDHDLDPNNDDSNLDPDGDGLNNGEEYNEGTDPRDPDTDDDGLLDGDDPTPARPLDDIFLPVITKNK